MNQLIISEKSERLSWQQEIMMMNRLIHRIQLERGVPCKNILSQPQQSNCSLLFVSFVLSIVSLVNPNNINLDLRFILKQKKQLNLNIIVECFCGL